MIHPEALRIAGMLLQDGGAMPLGSTLFMIFVGVVSVSVVIQTIVIITFAMGASKAQREFLRIADEMRAKSVPVLEASRAILEETAPKLRVITDNISEASFLLRDQAQRLDRTVQSTLNTVNEQVSRADAMISNTLDGIEEITSTVHHAVMIPVKQVVGLMNGLKAMVENLTGSKLGRMLYKRDEDDFV
jgi:methyl-accepting chemotaxis protein